MQKHTFFWMSKHVFDDIFCQRKFVKYQIEVKTPLLTKNVNKLPRLFSPFSLSKTCWDIRYFSDFFQKSCFVKLLMSFLRLKIKLRKLIFCCCFPRVIIRTLIVQYRLKIGWIDWILATFNLLNCLIINFAVQNKNGTSRSTAERKRKFFQRRGTSSAPNSSNDNSFEQSYKNRSVSANVPQSDHFHHGSGKVVSRALEEALRTSAILGNFPSIFGVQFDLRFRNVWKLLKMST